MAVKQLDLARTWADAVAMARSNLDALSAIAGMFILLPGLVSGSFLPQRVLPKGSITPADLLASNMDYITANWPLITLNAIVVAFGSLVILSFLVMAGRPTVREAMQHGLRILPSYMLVSLVQTLVVAGGLVLFIVPGIYLMARFICIAPVTVAENPGRPLAIIGRSVQLTRGHGWRIILLLAVVLLVAIVISTVVGIVVGVVSAMALPMDMARFVSLLVGSILEAALAVTVTLVSAALYRQTAA